MRETIRSNDAPAPIGPYSQAVATAEYVFFSGQVGLDPQSGNLVDGDVAAQTDRALRNLRGVLTAAGVDFSDIVKTTVFLVDMNDFAAMNAVYATFFGESAPARSTIAVAGLPKNARVEIDAIARRR